MRHEIVPGTLASPTKVACPLFFKQAIRNQMNQIPATRREMDFLVSRGPISRYLCLIPIHHEESYQSL